MKKIILFLFSLVCLCFSALASDYCFIAKENNVFLKTAGDCDKRYSPCSSFKIPLALMGYDSGILKNKNSPSWPFEKHYDTYLEACKYPQTPNTWVKNSCVWYSQILTSKLGMQNFQNYVDKFNYGNKNLSGDVGKNNGITSSWLSSSLEISPKEQLMFLEKLITNTLPASKSAHELTKNILYLETLKNGWKLYGKTGSGYLLNPDKTEKLEIKHGWFVGWVEKNNRKIIFTTHIIDDTIIETHAGPRAKELSKAKLLQLLEPSS